MKKLDSYKVSLNENSYGIYIGRNLLQSLGDFIPNETKYSKIIVVTDKIILKKWRKLIIKNFKENLNCEVISIEGGEKTKSFRYLENLIEKILKIGVDRKALLICLGGGVLGDLVSLASSLILRGIDLIQVPTTLLSQVDSSVGGKTGINSKYGKNLIGTFKQPKAVIISTELLDTLPKREIKSGYAEILKYAFIKDKDFFKWLEINAIKLLNLDSKTCAYAIKKSCSIKAKVVSKDEKESGLREILNFGHTFGHAIESTTGYSKKILHGESIFLGMYLAIKFSVFMKLCSTKILNSYINHLEQIKVPFKLADYKIRTSPSNFIKHMKFDKKVKNDKIKLVLIKGIGDPVRLFLQDETNLKKFLRNELD